jgi:hypothetical protein
VQRIAEGQPTRKWKTPAALTVPADSRARAKRFFALANEARAGALPRLIPTYPEHRKAGVRCAARHAVDFRDTEALLAHRRRDGYGPVSLKHRQGISLRRCGGFARFLRSRESR